MLVHSCENAGMISSEKAQRGNVNEVKLRDCWPDCKQCRLLCVCRVNLLRQNWKLRRQPSEMITGRCNAKRNTCLRAVARHSTPKTQQCIVRAVEAFTSSVLIYH